MKALRDTKIKENLYDYFKFKEKNNQYFTKQERFVFMQTIKKEILSLNNNQQFKIVYIPETDNYNLKELAQYVGEQVIVVKKQSKEIIIKELEKQNYQKKEKESLLNSLETMNTIKMANIKGNQRKRFLNILFKDIKYLNDCKIGRSLLLDDGVFSGFTFEALKNKVGKTDQEIVIFSKLENFNKES